LPPFVIHAVRGSAASARESKRGVRAISCSFAAARALAVTSNAQHTARSIVRDWASIY
jgi:hypothetical protein